MLEKQQNGENMKKYIGVLKRCPLFVGIEEAEICGMLDCLGASVIKADRGQIILAEGDPANRIGIVLRGSVQVVREDYYSNRDLLAIVLPGQLFAEAFACAGVKSIPVSVIAAEESEIMLVSQQQALTRCEKGCDFHNRLVSNLLQIVAAKNLALNRKIEFMSQKTTAQKLMAFLLWQAKQAGSSEFSIPFDRQQLADYLGVERSAMSAELSKLRQQGRIEYKKNRFCLIEK
jgi:CRP-like cAMP-binding protein